MREDGDLTETVIVAGIGLMQFVGTESLHIPLAARQSADGAGCHGVPTRPGM